MLLLFSACLLASLPLALAGQESGVAPVAPGAGPPSDDEVAVVTTVEALLAAINAGDGDAVAELLHPEGRFFSRVSGPEGEAGTPRPAMSTTDFVDAIAAPGPALVERMWEPVVQVHGVVAQLWAPYDFYRDEAFSHCGVDAFHLVKEQGRWWIVGGVWTVDRPPACALHPGGPPDGTERDVAPLRDGAGSAGPGMES